MKLTRYFFISDDLDDLERFEEELESAGLVTPQIHVLTLEESDADHHHHLHKVTAFMKQDVIHSTIIGAGVGVVMAIVVLVVAYLAGWTDTPAGWLPFTFLALITLGFFTWEGGLWGIDTPNVHFRNFENALQQGRHVFFVDVEPHQEEIVRNLVDNHPTVEAAGTGRASPHWVVRWQHGIKRFFTQTFP